MAKNMTETIPRSACVFAQGYRSLRQKNINQRYIFSHRGPCDAFLILPREMSSTFHSYARRLRFAENNAYVANTHPPSNVVSTSRRRYDVTVMLKRCYCDVVCLLGNNKSDLEKLQINCHICLFSKKKRIQIRPTCRLMTFIFSRVTSQCQ